MGSLLERTGRALQNLTDTMRARLSGSTGRRIERRSVPGPSEQALSLDKIRRLGCAAPALSLPPNLQQVLSTAPLAPNDPGFVGRTDALDTIGRVIEQWRAGVSTMLLITGPQGSGITSLMLRIRGLLNVGEKTQSQVLSTRLGRSDDVLRLIADWFQLEQRPDSAQDLIAQLRAAAPRVMLIDDGHYLVNRMAGLEATRVFGSILVATQDRHLWVLGCRHQAFARLVNLHHADRFFSHWIELGYFTPEELSEAFRLRFEQAGLTLADCEAAADIPPSGPGPTRLRELYQRSGGKLDAAFLSLLGACRLDETTGHWCIEPPQGMDVAVLQTLEHSELFTLAELIVHGGLSIEEHRALFRLPHEASALTLEYLFNLGLLDRIGESASGASIRYQVTKPIWALVVKYLETANYLY